MLFLLGFWKGVFLKGHGYTLEPVDGGIQVHFATPAGTRNELNRFGFKVVEILPFGFPAAISRFRAPWYHYACIYSHGGDTAVDVR